MSGYESASAREEVDGCVDQVECWDDAFGEDVDVGECEPIIDVPQYSLTDGTSADPTGKSTISTLPASRHTVDPSRLRRPFHTVHSTRRKPPRLGGEQPKDLLSLTVTPGIHIAPAFLFDIPTITSSAFNNR